MNDAAREAALLFVLTDVFPVNSLLTLYRPCLSQCDSILSAVMLAVLIGRLIVMCASACGFPI